MPKKQKTYPYGDIATALVFVAFFAFMGLATYIWLGERTEFEISCDFEDIEYKKLVEDAKCWEENIHPDYCPLPRTIRCEVKGKVPTHKLVQMLEGFDY